MVDSDQPMRLSLFTYFSSARKKKTALCKVDLACHCQADLDRCNFVLMTQ